MRRSLILVAAVFALVSGLGACSPAPPGGGFNDPYEQANRARHEGSKRFDQRYLRPTALALTTAPDPTEDAILNFAANAELPGMVVNGVLQGDIAGAAQNTGRFLVNTTVGLLGFLDPASSAGLFAEETDFGETLAVWGVPEGAYLDLPVIGPTTERDAVGDVVDRIIDPLGMIANRNQTIAATVAGLTGRVIERGRFSDTIDSVLYDSADSYAQTRLTYLQNRRFELGDAAGNPDTDVTVNPEIDPFADPFQ